jgi:hypothetical protein
MSGTDKTGDKLVASIRRTKAGSGKPAQTSSEKTTKTSSAPNVYRDEMRKSESGVSSDPYSIGGRVWPD